MRADNISTLTLDEAIQSLEHVLQTARAFDRKPGSQDEEEDKQQSNNQHFHRNGVGDGRVRIGGLNVQRAQQRSHRAAKGMVQKASE